MAYNPTDWEDYVTPINAQNMNKIEDELVRLDEIAGDIETSVEQARLYAQQSGNFASESEDYSIESKSYAKGGTNTREDEDTDNAKYYKDQAKQIRDSLVVIDNLNSTSSVNPLSANMGHQLRLDVDILSTRATNLEVRTTNVENKIGAPNGLATLDASGRVPRSQLTVEAMEYFGKWDASTNTPEITPGVGNTGDYYICSVPGTWNNIEFDVNDQIIFDGKTLHDWDRIPASSVKSVNGQSGQVTLEAEDIPFDNTGTALTSTQTQSAIVEVLSKAGVKVITITMADYLAHQAEYDASDNLYVISDSGLAGTAANTSFDNTNLSNPANNVQSAITNLDSEYMTNAELTELYTLLGLS